MPPYMSEQLGKQSHDLHLIKSSPSWVEGAVIVGAGPSGMATAACLRTRGVPYVMLERAECIASLWKQKTYDRLHLHIAKQYCELPLMPYPESYPTFLTKNQLVDYLDDYASKFNIQPRFKETVQLATFDEHSQTWRIHTVCNDTSEQRRAEYITRWLVVASGENSEIVVPNFPGLNDFNGSIIHSSQYKSGFTYAGRNVLVVGSGNSGMEIALDLVNSKAKASIVVRSPLHVLPRQMLGKSTFSVVMWLSRMFPTWFVDYLLVSYSKLALGDTSMYGLKRPKVGPLELKNTMGKTPVLDVGTLSRIKCGDIKVMPGVEHLNATGARFTDGSCASYDAVILATGYKSNVPRWLKDEEHFFTSDGFPSAPYPENWKGKKGLYAAGLCKKGLLGASMDAQRIAHDISQAYLEANTGQLLPSRSCVRKL